MEEFFKGISMENWSRGKNFKGDFFYKWDRNRVLSDPRYRPTPVLVMMKLKSESEWVFGPLFFFNLRYIKGGVKGNNNIGIKKCTTIFLWVLNLGQVGGRRKFFKITLLRWLFEKWSQKYDFGKNCKGITLEKMKIFFRKIFT